VNRHSFRRQQGAVLVVGMIMLVLISLMLITALNLGTTNFRAMSNMQFRSEAMAAANKAIEQVVSTPFTVAPTAEDINVDINNDDTIDYVVHIAEPECIFAALAFSSDPSSLSLPVAMSGAGTWNTVWDLDASVDGDENAGGATIRVRAGVRVLLTEAQKNAVCT
jgi:Tfp pilus assembly protein PilX